MTYNNLKDLASALVKLDMTDTSKVLEYRKLINVYFTALNNPPEGVIGVGAITFAEYQLIKAQESI